MTLDELIDTASPVIRDIGWAFFFAPETVAHAERLGLDVLSFYALGRGGVLGDVESRVVASAFGYFNPAIVEGMWTAGRAIIEPRTAGREYLEAAATYGRAKLADVEGLDAFCAAADAVIAAADPAGLTLFAGVSAEPLVDDAPGRAAQQLYVLRELRGSAHLAAVRAAGLDALTAHACNRPGDLAMFGWSDDDAPEITDEVRERMARAEAMTDVIVRPAWAVLDEPQRDAFLAGLRAAETAFTAA